jgi:hypothetical protein
MPGASHIYSEIPIMKFDTSGVAQMLRFTFMANLFDAAGIGDFGSCCFYKDAITLR